MGTAQIVPNDIAGGRITQKFISASEHDTVRSVKVRLLDGARTFDVIDYVYVVTTQNILVGVVSLKEILQTLNDEQPVGMLMNRKLVTIDYHSNQERIIYLVLRYKLKAIPVVNESTLHLEGVVPYDAILEVFHHEFREDILRSGGIHHRNHEIEELTTPASRLIRARIPSLVIGLLGGLLAASLITGFDSVLSYHLVLAAFIPVMIYLGDAVGTQSQTLVVRMIAIDPSFSIVRYMFRELKVGLTIGVIVASLLFAATMLGWSAPVQIGLVIALSIFTSMLFQSLMATYLSIVLSRFKIDPAVTSGPITTIISDISTLAMYFVIASLLLGLL
jgi:magnesium transporter